METMSLIFNGMHLTWVSSPILCGPDVILLSLGDA